MSRARRTIGLHCKRIVDEKFAPGDGLRYPRDVRNIEVYPDASFAPSAEQYNSVQGTLVAVAGCPVMRSSSRHTRGMVEGHQHGEGVSSLVEDVTSTLYADNRSAISLSSSDCGAWRARHLRLRAHGLG